MQDYERLGVFYLGHAPGREAAPDNLYLYDSRELVTHAVCIGMTGSGKTGLCLSLVEEAAIDHIPVIAIDPKGDISNLLLTFPNMSAEEFLPWINEDDARRQGVTPADYAAAQAQLWRNGLKESLQPTERVKLLRDSAEFLIYTPGSTAGLPVSILASLEAPPASANGSDDHLAERVSDTATSLLTLVGENVDPLKSRAHILVSSILQKSWQEGNSLTISNLIERIQKPPFERVGAVDIESFFPGEKRFELAMSFNNLLSAPSFQAWQKGDSLDFSKLLYNSVGKPRVIVFSIAHLADSERMFFVTLALNQLVAWMRSQSGTASLRALFYMDEIFGYFPPVANPPSKQPLLTLLKQARGYGVGLVLASQNPVDLDYKGLANAGTWFIGRLQTERDKLRLLDGLEGASAESGAKFDRQAMDKNLSALKGRVFLANNVHQDGPTMFKTRSTLSYLRGPLTRDQIKKLMDPVKAKAQEGVTAGDGASHPPVSKAKPASDKPALPPALTEFFLPLAAGISPSENILYEPRLLGSARVRFIDSKSELDLLETRTFLANFKDEALEINWSEASRTNLNVGKLTRESLVSAKFAKLPLSASQADNYKVWSKQFVDWLADSQKTFLLKSRQFAQTSKPGESERDFRIRLEHVMKEERDEAIEQLRKKYAVKLETMQNRVNAAQMKLENVQDQVKEQEMHSAISFGTTVLGAILSRRVSASIINRAGSAAKSASRITRKKEQVEDMAESLADLQELQAALENEMSQALSGIRNKFEIGPEDLDVVSVPLKKPQVSLQLFGLVWLPYRLADKDKMEPVW